MTKLDAARTAFKRGGAIELIKAGRRELARLIYPGALPTANTAPAPAKQTAAAMPTKKFAGTVGYDDAIAWFKPRTPTYVRLANAVRPYVDPNGLVLDVGANIGYFTKIFAGTLDFQGHVHLFEPVPHLAALCRQTTDQLPFKTTVHEFGLSDEDAEIEIYLDGAGNLGWNTIIAPKTNASMTPVRIQVRDYAAVGIDTTPSFVKIDVEGAEYKVLRGMLGAIERWSPRPAILCEVGWGQGHPAWQEELAVFDELSRLGYRAVDLDSQPIEVTGINKTTDIIFLPAHLVAPSAVPGDNEQAPVPEGHR